MDKAGQAAPARPVVPPRDVRLLRANLILEEALETIQALGFWVDATVDGNTVGVSMNTVTLTDHSEGCDIVEVVDGCCDISVVTTGTLSAFGVSDNPVQMLVDQSNLDKFGPGGYKREDGKWIKPPDWVPPNIELELRKQGYKE